MAANEGQILYGVWKKEYHQHYGRDYVGNVYRDSSMLKRVAAEVGQPVLFDLMKYYFGSSSAPDFTYFIFNYDKILADKILSEEDRDRRKKIRDRTRQRMKELGVPVGFIEESTKQVPAQHFSCRECGAKWSRPRQKGRPPVRCEDCKGKK